jgi:hypothetical protein
VKKKDERGSYEEGRGRVKRVGKGRSCEEGNG